MDELPGVGAAVTPEDDEFTVSQDTEFDEPDEARDDDGRSVDDSLDDELPGVDAERRVDLRDERAVAGDD
ncbi:hypothetical protein [Agromyces humatus]|uniref:Uncharacterized protein n=1 Tax=Agromyces humatus TaxID=279573 RepID=A0ABN2K4L8_9MICO|nr:hypothetical protein [Agromyces humatus]